MRVPPGSRLVFDQIVQSGTANSFGTYLKSEPKFNDWFGIANDLKVFVVVNRATNAGTLVVFMEEAGDEELAWFPTYGESSFIPPITVASPGETIATGADIEANRWGYNPTLSVGPRQTLGYRRLSIGFSSPTASSTCRVRAWATGHNGYRVFHRLLIAERLQGAGILTGPNEACTWLAGTDLLTVGVQTDEVSGTSPQLSVHLGGSGDGRSWIDDTSSGAISITSGLLYPLAVFSSSSSRPPYGFTRFGVQLAAADNAATVRLWVTGRDVRSG